MVEITANNLTYIGLKSMIQRKTYTTIEDMQLKLDVFYMNDRITTEQYNELTALLNTHKEEI